VTLPVKHRHGLSLAVTSWRQRTSPDESEFGRTSADTPQTVLKTAGVASAGVCCRPPMFGREWLLAGIVRFRLHAPAMLAVFLAVSQVMQAVRVRVGGP
jgi:hypothetical protein